MKISIESLSAVLDRPFTNTDKKNYLDHIGLAPQSFIDLWNALAINTDALNHSHLLACLHYHHVHPKATTLFLTNDFSGIETRWSTAVLSLKLCGLGDSNVWVSNDALLCHLVSTETLMISSSYCLQPGVPTTEGKHVWAFINDWEWVIERDLSSPKTYNHVLFGNFQITFDVVKFHLVWDPFMDKFSSISDEEPSIDCNSNQEVHTVVVITKLEITETKGQK